MSGAPYYNCSILSLGFLSIKGFVQGAIMEGSLQREKEGQRVQPGHEAAF